MRKLQFTLQTFMLLLFCCSLQSNSQKLLSSEINFLNAPVLLKENGQSYQQVIVSYHTGKSGKIVFTSENVELLAASFKNGDNKFLLQFKAVTKPKEINISVKIDENPIGNYPFTLAPTKKWQVFFVQHSHTDIGYTRPQSEILAEQLRYIDYALDYCDQTDNLPNDAKFRWTCESAWVTREYLRSRPQKQIERLKKRIAEGRIEVTAMSINMAEIADENIMFDFLQPLKDIKNNNIPVKTAMQNDVNGIAWCMPDYFKNTGVKYLIMGINETRSILPFDKPTCFWWKSPSGERLLAFRADHYMTGNKFGIESDNFKPDKMLWHLADLDNRGYPFDKIGIQFSGYITDNSPPSLAACETVKQWNEKYEYPKLKLAGASEFMEYVDKNYSDKLPVYRNAWLDWWSDGFGSTSRETAVVRKVQNLKQVDEGLLSMVIMLGGELGSSLESKIAHISENVLFFDEHTCGADESINHPFSENSTKQWLMKGAYAWEALKKVTLLNEEVLARFQEFLKKADSPLIYVINSMGWSRSGNVELFIDYEILPLKRKVRIIDISTGKEIPTQLLKKRRDGAYWTLEVSDIPAMGYKAFKIEVTEDTAITFGEVNLEILENSFYKIVIDKSTGSIKSLFDKELNHEIIDNKNPYNIGQLVKETSAKRDQPPFIHTTISNVKVGKGTNGAVWESVRIISDLEGFEKGMEGEPKGIVTEIRLYKNIKKVELKYMANKLIVTNPEALYVTFPFSLPNSKIVYETIGGTLSQGQQLPGSSSDWNVAQNFVSVRGTNGQIIVVSNEIPLWQFSDFNMGKFERYPKPGKTWLYSWVMNNYWFTNFRAYQEGAFSWSYVITSTADTTNLAATKFAWGERNLFLTRVLPAGKDENTQPVLQTLELDGDKNAVLINSRPAFNNNGSVLLHFREVEGVSAKIQLSSKIDNRPIKEVKEVNVLGEEVGILSSTVSIKPYEVKFIEVLF